MFNMLKSYRKEKNPFMLLNKFIKNMKEMVLNSEIKYTKEAKKYETLSIQKSADLYIEAMKKIDVFESHQSYSSDIIKKAGVPGNEQQILSMALDKNLIPMKYRDVVLEHQRAYIINNFEERNDYYRMLIGLPATTDNEYFYISYEDSLKYDVHYYDTDTSLIDYESVPRFNIDTQYYIGDVMIYEGTLYRCIVEESTIGEMVKKEWKYYIDGVAIHEMSNDDIFRLRKSGYIAELYEKNPTKKYLRYMGYDKINLIEARDALNFTLLKVNVDIIPYGVYDLFISTYAECREYFMTVIHNQDLSGRYNLYDSFIGLCIMVMTIQRCVAKSFEQGISRDFYDWIFVQKLYNSYNVPFLESLPLDSGA